MSQIKYLRKWVNFIKNYIVNKIIQILKIQAFGG